MEKNTKIIVTSYSDLLEKCFNLDSLLYEIEGSYQGDYLAVLKDKEFIYFYIGSYGSCSGCDSLEDLRNYEDEVEYKQALELAQSISLSSRMTLNLWNSLTNEQKLLIIPDSLKDSGYEEDQKWIDIKKKILNISIDAKPRTETLEG